MPYDMLEQIEAKARGRNGRSAWVRKAIITSLNEENATIEESTTKQLMVALAHRPDVDETLSKLLVLMVKG